MLKNMPKAKGVLIEELSIGFINYGKNELIMYYPKKVEKEVLYLLKKLVFSQEKLINTKFASVKKER